MLRSLSGDHRRLRHRPAHALPADRHPGRARRRRRRGRGGQPVPRHRQGHQRARPPPDRRRDPQAVRAPRGPQDDPRPPGLPGPALLPPLRRRPERPREAPRRTLTDEEWKLAEQFADEWDQKAFDPDYDTLPLEHFEDPVRQVFARRGCPWARTPRSPPPPTTTEPDPVERERGGFGRPARAWASSKSSWISPWSRSVSWATALRGVRPDSVRSGAGSGAPTISTSLVGLQELGALGHHRLAAADAHRDDRHVGLGRHVGGAVEHLLHDGAGLAGALGEHHERAAAVAMSRARPEGRRSALPRCTGKAPSIDTNRPSAVTSRCCPSPCSAWAAG